MFSVLMFRSFTADRGKQLPILPKSKRKPVSNYSALWYKAQRLPELFVG